LSDKLHNARALLRDFRAVGEQLWDRFSVHDPHQHLWYYGKLLNVYGERTDDAMVGELRDVINTLGQEIGRQ
jgi:hypothetical protein